MTSLALVQLFDHQKFEYVKVHDNEKSIDI